MDVANAIADIHGRRRPCLLQSDARGLLGCASIDVTQDARAPAPSARNWVLVPEGGTRKPTNTVGPVAVPLREEVGGP